jgi:PAS domain S-box-containing protein
MRLALFTSLRSRLLFIVMLAVVPALGLAIHSGIDDRAEHILTAKNGLLELADGLSAFQETLVENARRTLFVLSQLPQVRREDADGVSAVLTGLLKQSEGVSAFLASDAKGRVFAATASPAVPADIGDRPWFTEAMAGRAPVVGRYRIDPVSGGARLDVAYPIIDEGGRAAGVVGAALDLGWVSRRLAGKSLAPGARCIVMDTRGTVLAGYPETEVPAGKSAGGFAFFKTILERGRGTVDVTGPDGVRRIMGFTTAQLGPEPIIFCTSAPDGVVFAKADRDLLVHLGLLLCAALATFLATWFAGRRCILRHVNSLLRLAGEVAGGNLSPAESLAKSSGELEQLALAFERMTKSLQHRESLRLEAENKLRQINGYLEDIFENSPDSIGIVDEHGKFKRWNKRASEQFGYSFEEMEKKSAFELYADREQLQHMMAELRREGVVKNYVIDMKKKNGEIAVFQLSISRLQDESGRTIGSICVGSDLSPLQMAYHELQEEVDHRKAVEESLRKSEATYRESEAKYRNLYEEFNALLDAIPDTLVLLTPDFKPVWANRAYAINAGENRDHFCPTGQCCFEQLHGLEEPCVWCPAPQSFGSGKPATSVITTEKGSVLEVRSVPMHDENGKVIKLINVARDITEARRAEERLQRTNKEMEYLLASIPSFLIGLNPEHQIVQWNKAAERTFGIDSVAALGKDIDRCGIQWNRDQIAEAISLCQTGDISTKLDECRFVKPEGKEGFLSVMISPVDALGNGHRGTLLLGYDVTERKILESQLVQAQKLESIGQLAAGIAHEINTPARYVGDNARFLQDACGDLERINELYDRLAREVGAGGQVEDLAHQIETTAEEIDLGFLREEIPKAIRQSLEGIGRISNIVRAMKEFSHPGTDVKKKIDLNRAIESTVTVARNEWKYVAEVTMELDPALPPVPCLPGELNQVILNVIINASHAVADAIKQNGSEEKGTITIRTLAREDYAEIRIGDTGTGIPENIRSKIFDPFFTTKEVGRGTGQGLAISHSVIVDKHGGSISFETEEGRGTTFIIRLPLKVSEEP